jgi:hypothetical protein
MVPVCHRGQQRMFGCISGLQKVSTADMSVSRTKLHRPYTIPCWLYCSPQHLSSLLSTVCIAQYTLALLSSCDALHHLHSITVSGALEGIFNMLTLLFRMSYSNNVSFRALVYCSINVSPLNKSTSFQTKSCLQYCGAK